MIAEIPGDCTLVIVNMRLQCVYLQVMWTITLRQSEPQGK